MANKNGISTALKRNLKDGKEYWKLIPRVRCERTNLGEGDTFFTVDAMRGWIEKYSFQTAKLAPRLVGRNLEETVNKVYSFLYSHVQYEADGPLQQLRSPACTWAQRKEGVDCKSFSVFASSILSNLGIKHFIRQIRQPYFYPEEFTHVYVVVPKDQNDIDNSATFVLDATKHQNVESSYIEKVDLKMTKLQHIGLNAPQDERTRQIVENFEKFCKKVLEKGVPLSIVNAMRTRVSKFTSAGKDPKFAIVEQGVVIEGVLFRFLFDEYGRYQSEYQGGLGIEPVTMAAVGGALKLLPPGFFEDTFGAIFANGFNTSCWGSSNSPSKSKTEVSVDGPDFYKRAGLEQTISAENITKFAEMAKIYIAARAFGETNRDLAGCTREGNKMGKELMQQFLDQTLVELRGALGSKNMTLKTVSQRTPTSGTIKINSTYHNGGISKTRYSVQVPVYKIEGGERIDTPPPSTGGNYQPTPGETYQPVPGNTANINDQPGSKTGLIIGGIAAAAAIPLFFMKKGSIDSAIQKAKTKKSK